MVGAWDTGSHSSEKRPVSRLLKLGKRKGSRVEDGRDDVPGSAMAGSLVVGRRAITAADKKKRAGRRTKVRASARQS